jgi:DNA polymerase III alpha subunit (gram-positive type)
VTDEIYISVDVETDGPIPGPHSMLSIGAAAFTKDGDMLSTFSRNLYPMEGSSPDPSTAKWWMSQPEALAEVNRDREEPKKVMLEFNRWCNTQPGKPVFVAYPAGFDFTFVYWYLMKFVGHSAFAMNALDMKSFAMAVTGSTFTDSRTSKWPKHWMVDEAHSHIAVEDAIEQGKIFCKMLKSSRQL